MNPMTRRASLIALAGLASGFLVSGSLGLPGSVAAQSESPTKTGIKAKTKAAMKKGQVKWESLTPEEKEQVKAKLNTTVEQAQAKWESLPPERQEQLYLKGQATSQAARKKWQSLPK